MKISFLVDIVQDAAEIKGVIQESLVTPEDSAPKRKSRGWIESSLELDEGSKDEAAAHPGGHATMSDARSLQEALGASGKGDEASSGSLGKEAMLDIMDEIDLIVEHAGMPPPPKRLRSETPSPPELPDSLCWPPATEIPAAKDTTIPSLIEMVGECEDIEMAMDSIYSMFPIPSHVYSRALRDTFAALRLGVFRYRQMATKRMAKMLWLLAGNMGLELQREAAGMVGSEHLPADLKEFGLQSPEPLDEAGLLRRHDEVQAFLNPIFSRYVSNKRRDKGQKPSKRYQRKKAFGPVPRAHEDDLNDEEEEEHEHEQERQAYDIYSSRKNTSGRADAPYKLREAPPPNLGRKVPWVLRGLPLDDGPPPLPRWGTRRRRTGWEKLLHMQHDALRDFPATLPAEIYQKNDHRRGNLSIAGNINSSHHEASRDPESDATTPDAPVFGTKDMRNLLGTAFDSIVTEISKQAVLTLGSPGSHRRRDPRLQTLEEGSASPR